MSPKSNFESNLTIDELDGLKSLRKRIQNGELVVCQTDKSKRLRFAVLSKSQYLEAGLVQKAKDLEIEPDKIKRVQNFVNDHVSWISGMINVGSNWNQQDRVARNVVDKGEQTCQMSLLLKDHKNWSRESGCPIPSRPVVAGNMGLNCHLSELISHIIDPISYEHSGNEVDSSDDLLAKIEKLNETISRKSRPDQNMDDLDQNERVENVVIEQSVAACVNVEKNQQNHKKGDIRNFGVVGKRTVESNGSFIFL